MPVAPERTAAPARAAAPDTRTAGSRARALLSAREAPVVGALVVALLGAGLFVDMFATGRNIDFLVLSIAAIALMALPMTLIVITGEIDLSVASTLALTSATLGVLWEAGIPIETALWICLAVGAALGALNGFLVTVCGLPSLAVTIGTMALYRGLAYVLLGDRAVASYPRDWVGGARAPFLGIEGLPWIAVAVLVLAAAFAVLLHATGVGRSLFDIGNNDEAARFSGVPVAWTRFWLFTLSGVVASGAGIFWTLQYGTSRADTAFGLELQVVAAVLLGGVSIFGGVGSVLGVMSGVLLLGTIRNALQLFGISSEVLQIVTGLILIASVVTPNIAARVRAAREPGPRPAADPAPDPTQGEPS
ncbi:MULTISPECIES: ABC transporter permease [Nocardiopsidaceae]|uniref:Autoinducer 2 import system permease protein LsrD n=1 Tax=Streptomonospora nanhaiensis TaxID=1323731 RepID=A0ABY6YUM4_9ACTN|nr:ABC transporter permease [Streptomonospora nanhaiensis]WAE76103.1 ABC transporter permease [Streptomonospora nanhaiensis]